MIITRTPFRISFFGGGTDHPQWYQEHGGKVLSVTIDKYCYVSVRPLPPFFPYKHRIVYSKEETVKINEEIKHPVVRECFKLLNIQQGVELHYAADLPARVGLGSSSSFTVGLLNALYNLKGKWLGQRQLAYKAIEIERNKVGDVVGSQDQVAVACGGLNTISFSRKGNFSITPFTEYTSLEKNLMLFFTGFTRLSSEVESDKIKHFKQREKELKKMTEMVDEGFQLLKKCRIKDFGLLLHESWMLKKSLSSQVSNADIDMIYENAKKAGAIGGKLCFTPETVVRMEDGYKRIDKINKDDKIIDYKNYIQKVIYVYKRKYIGNLLELTVNGLQNKIRVTPEHPLFTTIKHPRGKRINKKIINIPIFKEAKEFRKGDVLLRPINEFVKDLKFIKLDKKLEQKKYSRYQIYDHIPNNIPITSGFLNALGWYIAEGSSSRKQFNFAFHKDEISYAKELSAYLKKTFNRNTVIKNIDKTKTNGIYLIGSSIVLSDFLKLLCGSGAENKKIPKFVMNLPKEKQIILLSSLWRGDGCVLKPFDKRTNKFYVRCTYKTVSVQLAKQVQELCFRLGYICSIKKEINNTRLINKKNSTLDPVYILSISGEDAIAFSKSIEQRKIIKVNRSNKKSLSLSKDIIIIDGVNYAKRSILKIEQKKYIGDVYNLYISGTHTYIIEDIVVHNCGAGNGGMLLLVVPRKRQVSVKNRLNKLLQIPFAFERTGSIVIDQFPEYDS